MTALKTLDGLAVKSCMSPERKGNYRVSFEQIISNAKELTLRDGHHVPILIAEGSKNFVINQIQAMPDTHSARAQLLDLLGRTLAKSGRVGKLRQVFLISEGWMSKASVEKPPKMRPSEDPDRLEVLIVSGIQIEGNTKNLTLFGMQRDDQNRLVELREIQPPEERAGGLDVPLLDAFVQGFQKAFQAQVS